MRQRHRQYNKPPISGSSGTAPFPTTPTSPSPGCTTPLSAIPDLSLPEGGVAREAVHVLERTASGSPIKVVNKRERLSLSEVPGQKRPPALPSSSSTTTSEVVLLTGSSTKTKQRRRKPSSSNESSTSEAPSNASDLSLLPPPPPTSSSIPGSVLPNPSPSSSSSLGNHLIPISPAPLPSRAAQKSHQPHHGEGSGVGGGEGAVVKVERSAAEDEVVQQMLEVGAEQFSVPSMTVAEARDVVSGLAERRITTSSSTSSEQGSRIQAPPPRSLQELLERQWEQTAQFILDQAGKQNNAGSMLAHLHTLQTENRQMQSRIMELASQREFYLAINTKLRQTLSEHDLGRLPNGIQSVDNGVQQQLVPIANSVQEPMEVSNLSHLPLQDHTHHCLGHHAGHHRDARPLTPPSPQLSNALPQEDQESLLHAHFSSSTATPSATVSSMVHPSRGDHSHHCHDNALSEMSSRQHHAHLHQQQQQEVVGGAGSHAHASNFLSTFTQLPPQVTSQGLPSIGPVSLAVDTMHILPPSHSPTSSLVDYTNRVPQVPTGDSNVSSLHEVTQVTHSIQAPISSLTPLPNEVGVVEQTGGVSMCNNNSALAAPYSKDKKLH